MLIQNLQHITTDGIQLILNLYNKNIHMVDCITRQQYSNTILHSTEHNLG